jgi:LysM repeat protein
VADDPGKTPAPRPRRRRTDIDPSYQPPKVVHERRRAKAPRSVEEAPALEAVAAPGEVVAASDRVVDAASHPADATQAADAGDGDDVAQVAGAGDGDAIAGAADATPAKEPPEADLIELEAAPTEQTRLFAIPPVKPPESAAAIDANGESWLAILDDRSSDPAICPFLRAVVGDGIGRPVEAPDAANRCAALREPVPQSLRQQELVCLTTGHVNCPRYLRGAAVVCEVPTPVVSAGRTRLTPAVFGSIVLLIGAFALSVGFVASRGGMEVASIASAAPSVAAVASASPAPSTAAAAPSVAVSPSPVVASAVPSPSATVAPTPTPMPSPTPSPSPTAEPTPSPSSTPRPTATSKPRSNRYALLTACPGTAKCWIYRVRSGDNLYSIARYFGVPIAKVYAMNTWLKSTGLKSGQTLRLPPPTR